MDMHQPTGIDDVLSGDFVLVEFDGTRLLLDQASVAAVHELSGEPEAGARAGHFVHASDDGAIPLVAPTRRLRLLPELPPARRFVLVLADGDIRLGLACEAMQVLPRRQFRGQALPAVMRDESSPVARVVEIADALAFHCDGPRLLKILSEAEL